MLREADVRDLILRDVLGDLDQSEVVYEFWIPGSNVRADLVALTPTMRAFEIKTDRDTLRRLPSQARAYQCVFDTCCAVVAPRHLGAVAQTLPKSWGLYVVGESAARPTVSCERPPAPNDEIDSATLVRLLWRDEACSALRSLGHEPEPSQTRSSMWEDIMGICTPESLREIVRTALSTRDASLARIPTRRFADQVAG